MLLTMLPAVLLALAAAGPAPPAPPPELRRLEAPAAMRPAAVPAESEGKRRHLTSINATAAPLL